jgi:hypothetical protein
MVGVLSAFGRRMAPVILVFVVAAASVAADKVNRNWRGLALDGYDPVAYFTENRPVKGDPAITAIHAEATYRFASTANRDRFLQAPQQFLPQYGGFCAWAVSRGYTADTDPLAWRIVDGRLFLNYNQDVQKKWAEDVEGNIRRGDANWPGLNK